MDMLEMTPEQSLAFEGFIDIMVEIFKMTSDKIDYSKVAEKEMEQAEDGDADKAEA